MKAYQSKGYEYFYDRFTKQWVMYPIDSEGNRIEWDSNDEPIESMYFNNKAEVNTYLASK
jgi:hypothetical protein